MPNINELNKDNKLYIILILIVISFIIRFVFLNIPKNIGDDAANYAIIGKNLIDGVGFIGINGKVDTVSSPLYPVFIGLFYRLLGDLELAGRLVSIVYGSFLVVPVYLLSSRIYNRKIAAISGILISVYFILIQYSIEVLSESMYAFFLAAGAVIGYVALIERKHIHYLMTGSCFGLCYLTRAEGFGYIFIFMIIVIIFWLFDNKLETTRRLMIYLCIFMLGFLIISSPYFIFMHNQTGHWISDQKAGINIEGADAMTRKDPLAAQDAFYGLIENGTKMRGNFLMNEVKSNTFNLIINNPLKMLKIYGRNVGDEYYCAVPKIFPTLMIMLVGIGLFRRRWSKERLMKEVYIFLILIYPLILYPLFHIEYRYLMPVLPMAIIWAANGINELQDWVEHAIGSPKMNSHKICKYFYKNFVLVIVIFSLVLMTFLIPLHFNSDIYSNQANEYKEAGLWMKKNVPENPAVMAKRPYISFYAEGTFVPLPFANYTSMIKYAKIHDVRYIAIDRIETLSLRPQLAFLLNRSLVPKNNLELIYENDKFNKILIYRLI